MDTICKLQGSVRQEYGQSYHPAVMKEEIMSLYRSVHSLLPDSQRKVIQFVGSREGEGTSTIVREFAMVSASTFGHSVLLLDADVQRPSQHPFFKISPLYTCEDVIKNGESIDNAFYQVGNSRLFVSIISKHTSSLIRIFDDNFCETLQQFDLILVDSPPATASSDGLAICRVADGIVLILEAEKTRWPIAESIKNRIIKNGGNILGIAFNKRRHHIPGFIYKRL